MNGFIDHGPAAQDPVEAARAADQLGDHQRNVAHHAQVAARNAADYRGTTFSYGTGTGTNLANATHARHVQQMVASLARRRARQRHQVAEQEGDTNTDEPGGVEGIDYEIEASQERHDAAYHSAEHRRVALRRRAHGKHRHGAHGAHDAEEGGAESEADEGEVGEGGAHHERHVAPHARVHRQDGRRDGGGGQGGREQRQQPGNDTPRKGTAGSRGGGPGAVRMQPPRVAPGPAIDTKVAPTGPLQRLAAELPRDALRESRLHEAHFEQLWSLRRRALSDPGASFEAGVHAIEFDWNEAQRRHGAVKPQEGAVIRDRLVDATRKDGAPPAGMPALRIASMNLLMFLVLLSSESPATPAQRRVAADTRIAQGRLHRLARAAAKPGA